MKKMFGVLAILILAVGFSFTACDGDGGGGGQTATLIIKNETYRQVGRFMLCKESPSYLYEWKSESDDVDYVLAGEQRTFSNVTLLASGIYPDTLYVLGFYARNKFTNNYGGPQLGSTQFKLPAGSTKTITITLADDKGTPNNVYDDVYSFTITP